MIMITNDMAIYLKGIAIVLIVIAALWGTGYVVMTTIDHKIIEPALAYRTKPVITAAHYTIFQYHPEFNQELSYKCTKVDGATGTLVDGRVFTFSGNFRIEYTP